MKDRLWALLFIGNGLVMIFASTLPYPRSNIYIMLWLLFLGLGGIVIGVTFLARLQHPRLFTWMLNLGAIIGLILMYLTIRLIIR
jgi:hypothetical protein